MESFGGSEFTDVGCPIRKKRSSISRRPRYPAHQIFIPNFNLVSLPSQAIGSSSNEDQNHKNGSNGLGSENKLKLKLKLGGVTHTIHTKSTSDYASGGVPTFTKSSHFSDAPQTREKSFLLDEKGSYLSDKEKGYNFQWKDYSRGSSGYGKEYFSGGNAPGVSVALNATDRNEPIRKSKRVPKRRVLDVGLNSDDDGEDEEIRYLGRLNASNGHSNYKDEEDERNGRDISNFEDKDYMDEEEPISDDEPGSKRKKLGRGSVDLFGEGRTESIPTTRNRALQSGKDLFSGSGVSLIEFPDGLPPALPKKQKEKLSEVDQQMRKAEAAQRRRLQSEKAAREAEAEAIRRILGQDSGRKKREEKIKKQRDELAQGKAAKSETLASNTVRWVIGPGGTTVIFSEDIGLPQLFSSMPISYPPPREKCAAPNCTNTYKYRDSKSKLPLCSLDCYKAVQGKTQPLIAC
ncbi:PAPA-1-like conserved region [Corchorus olitorius]|uniref:PAPA-1-like conserved region n=1 Tax=Corchorus olitorius TaxID=93759 RepID=A0A1R3GK66_9ROSI|nr:PAPA-1-like conserved region [Corchorus olitorius]